MKWLYVEMDLRRLTRGLVSWFHGSVEVEMCSSDGKMMVSGGA